MVGTVPNPDDRNYYFLSWSDMIVYRCLPYIFVSVFTTDLRGLLIFLKKKRLRFFRITWDKNNNPVKIRISRSFDTLLSRLRIIGWYKNFFKQILNF